MDFVSAKRGLAAALHSGDPAYSALPTYFDSKLRPALTALLKRAAAAGEIRDGIAPGDLLSAVVSLCRAGGRTSRRIIPRRRMVSWLW